jgi:hypothetical protein
MWTENTSRELHRSLSQEGSVTWKELVSGFLQPPLLQFRLCRKNGQGNERKLGFQMSSTSLLVSKTIRPLETSGHNVPVLTYKLKKWKHSTAVRPCSPGRQHCLKLYHKDLEHCNASNVCSVKLLHFVTYAHSM